MSDLNPCDCTLTFKASLRLVSLLRRFIVDFYAPIFGDRAEASRIGLAAHELIENAVKYGTSDEVTVEVRVLRGTEPTVCIRTHNRASPENIRVLRQQLAEIDAASNIVDHYHSVISRSARRAHGSGLGLARVAAEADMRMSAEFPSSDAVVLTAQASVSSALRTAC